ncbi:MAG: protein phosphatase 2C domain-containing protein [Desulfobacterales bacterium]
MFRNPKCRLTIEAAALTDVGRVRSQNQDAFLIDPQIRLYAVADGMGGHRAGEVASAMVVDALQRYFRESRSETLLSSGASTEDQTLSEPANRVQAAVHHANRAVFEASRADEKCRGMGSTIAAVWFDSGTAIAANVGDSPIFLLHDGAIERLSVPHTVEEEERHRNPEISESPDHPFRHMLTRGMGVDPVVDADICEVQCFSGDRMVLCSDGLSNHVSPEEILDIVVSAPAESACAHLLNLANERGGEDNITVMILTVVGPPTLAGGWMARLDHVRKWVNCRLNGIGAS